MNKFIFSGNLGRDCKVSTTQKGTSVCSFSVAVKSGYGDNAKTSWVNVAMFGKRAESRLPDYLLKGQKVLVTGEANLHEYQKKDGTTGASIEVVADDIELIGAKEEGQPRPPVSPTPGWNQAQQPAHQPQQSSVDMDSDDIPF